MPQYGNADKGHRRTGYRQRLQGCRHQIPPEKIMRNEEDNCVATGHAQKDRKSQRTLRENLIARHPHHAGEKTERQRVEHDHAVENGCFLGVEIVVPASNQTK